MSGRVVFGKVELACLVFFVCDFFTVKSQSVVFKTLRFEENYSSAHMDSTWSLYSTIKRLQFGRQAYLAFGGDARYQYFKIENEDWGETPESSDGFFLARHLLYGSLHVGRNWRIFGQLQNGIAAGKQVVSAVDENILEVHQVFVDYRCNINSKARFVVRLGRQEILYGSQRLVSVRNGPNTRQSFDGLSVGVNLMNTKLDFFGHCLVRSRLGVFNDRFTHDVKMWGNYLSHRIGVPILCNIDVYYIGFQRSQAQLDDGSGRELRHSIGMRVWKNEGSLMYDLESVFQTGTLGDQRIRAWTVSLNTAYTFKLRKLAPQFGLKTELISGNRRYDDKRVETFNPLFPNGAYFGLAALFGPSNLFDIHPTASLSFNRKLTWSVDYDVFWRVQEMDGIYANNNLPIYTGRDNPHKFIGQQFSTDLLYSFCTFASAQAEFKWFDAGQFLKAAGKGKDILFFAFTVQCIF